MLKQRLRKKVSSTASIAEISLSVFILLITVVAGVQLFYEMFVTLWELFSGKLNWDYSYFFDAAIELIIAVEFVKMLSKHSMGSAIEVLVFVIAKRVIIDGSRATALEVVLFVLAFAILFAIRKYLHLNHAPMGGDAAVYGGNTQLAEICRLYQTTIPEALGETIAEAVENCLIAAGRPIAVGEKAEFKDIIVQVEMVRDNKVEKVEIVLK